VFILPAIPAILTEHEKTEAEMSDSHSARRWRLARLAAVLGGVAAMIALYQLNAGVREELGRALAVLTTGDGAAIGVYLQGFGIWAPAASLGLMVVQAVAAPVPAILVAFANGLAFGVFWGGLLTVAGQTLAAAVCFGIARALGRGPVEALAGKLGLKSADRWLSQWGARGTFLLRLAPGISFDVISYGAGLTGIGFRPFILATAIGTAPQAFLYAYLIRESPQSAWVLFFGSWLVIGVLGSAAFVRRKWSEGEPVGPAQANDASSPTRDLTQSAPGAYAAVRGEHGVAPGGIAACTDTEVLVRRGTETTNPPRC
jgi:uncharacterized membrane protein YdjX (TVP38/TMEM64 family)